MKVTMDRYEADWAMVERGWKAHVNGRGADVRSAREAVETLPREPGLIDQDLPEFVVETRRAPVGAIGRRRGGVLQLPRRPGHRDLRAFDESRFDGVRSAAAPTCSTPG
jgi:2,3-bisphosphoglycerate-independent phosphoglycerate mutase